MSETRKLLDAVMGGLRPRVAEPLGRAVCKGCGMVLDLKEAQEHGYGCVAAVHHRLEPVADDEAVASAEGVEGSGS